MPDLPVYSGMLRALVLVTAVTAALMPSAFGAIGITASGLLPADRTADRASLAYGISLGYGFDILTPPQDGLELWLRASGTIVDLDEEWGSNLRTLTVGPEIRLLQRRSPVLHYYLAAGGGVAFTDKAEFEFPTFTDPGFSETEPFLTAAAGMLVGNPASGSLVVELRFTGISGKWLPEYLVYGLSLGFQF